MTIRTVRVELDAAMTLTDESMFSVVSRVMPRIGAGIASPSPPGAGSGPASTPGEGLPESLGVACSEETPPEELWLGAPGDCREGRGLELPTGVSVLSSPAEPADPRPIQKYPTVTATATMTTTAVTMSRSLDAASTAAADPSGAGEGEVLM
ncbi:MAG: hypothetical protein Q3979_03645 [Actinomycetaceae bacterium]|nr:hypothetical protein [Actinomycetaceae bacterium]